ncbi:MAG: efflux transporter outer membrane subunit [Desulfobacterales bacterium]|nr:efflux transporter outer membrane subunit [Desulfobacterales bacterium]
MNKFVFGILLLSMMLFSGCKTLEPHPETTLPLTIPENFSIDIGGSKTIENWWLSFDSIELNALIKDALDNNFDLKTLKTKLNQARARVEKENASFFPDLGFSFGGQKKRTEVKNDSSSDSTHDYSHSWDSYLTSSYTADVWGEASDRKQAQVSTLLSIEQDLRESTLTLATQIAEIWIDIVAARNKKSILNNQIKINKTLLKLQTLRFVNGKANALDVSQQREALAEASSQVPLLEMQERLLLNNLAFLSGKTTIAVIEMNTKTLPEPVPLPSTGIPSDLLKNRPDIQAAKMRLFSSKWEVAAARADLLPSFKLSAQALFSNGELDLMFHNWVATLAASIAGPIFDGGFRRAEVKRARAVAEEQLNLYAKTIATAIFEVEDSLVSIQKQSDYVKLLDEELELTRLTLKDASIQYQNGQSSYLPYLIAWSSIERLERQLVGERATIIKNQIKLYGALGLKPIE